MDPKKEASPVYHLPYKSNPTFDPAIAQAYGLLPAVIYSRIRKWVRENHRTGRNLDEDGFAWTYDTTKKMSEFMGFATPEAIKKALQKLKKRGAIISKTISGSNGLCYTIPRDQWKRGEETGAGEKLTRPIQKGGEILPQVGEILPQPGEKLTRVGEILPLHFPCLKDTPYRTPIEHPIENNTNTCTSLASLVSAPTSSSHLCQSEGVSSIGDGDAEPECSPRPIRRDSRGGPPPCGIKTPPPSRPPLKTRENARPEDPSKSPSQLLPDFPLVAISIEQREKLAAKHSPGLMAGVYEWYSGWKESKMETEPKMLPKATDYWRLTNWAIKAYKDRQETDSRFSAPKRKGHIHADEVAKKEMEARTAGLSEKAAMIVEERLSLDECLKSYRANGWLTLEDIRQAFPEYTGDGS